MKFNIDDLKEFEEFLKSVKYGHCFVDVQCEKVLKEFVPVFIFTVNMRIEDLEEFKNKFEEFKNENYNRIFMYFFDTSGFHGDIGYGYGAFFSMKWIGR